MGEWSYSSTILDLSQFTHESWSGHCGKEKNDLPLLGIKAWPSSHQPITIPTELFQLLDSVIKDQYF
jgi:hypothetical protein